MDEIIQQHTAIDATIEGIGKYAPKPDITALEASYMALLLCTAALPGNWDYQAFIKEHGLERHFDIAN